MTRQNITAPDILPCKTMDLKQFFQQINPHTAISSDTVEVHKNLQLM